MSVIPNSKKCDILGLQPTRYRCKITDCDGDNFQFDDFPEDLFTKKDDEPDYCTFYRPVRDDPNHFGNCSHQNFTEEEIDCPNSAEYVYAPFEFEETLVTKWNLVCGQSAKVAMVLTMFVLGQMIGSLLCGRMSDKWGRKKTLMLSILCSSLASLLGSFMPEYYSYIVTR